MYTYENKIESIEVVLKVSIVHDRPDRPPISKHSISFELWSTSLPISTRCRSSFPDDRTTEFSQVPEVLSQPSLWSSNSLATAQWNSSNSISILGLSSS